MGRSKQTKPQRKSAAATLSNEEEKTENDNGNMALPTATALHSYSTAARDYSFFRPEYLCLPANHASTPEKQRCHNDDDEKKEEAHVTTGQREQEKQNMRKRQDDWMMASSEEEGDDNMAADKMLRVRRKYNKTNQKSKRNNRKGSTNLLPKEQLLMGDASLQMKEFGTHHVPSDYKDEVEIVNGHENKYDTIFIVRQANNHHGQPTQVGWIIKTFTLDNTSMEIFQDDAPPSDRSRMSRTIYATDSSVLIQRPTTVITVLNHYSQKMTENPNSMDWQDLLPAFEHHLLQMELENISSLESSSDGAALSIRILLTQKANEHCSPSVLSRKVPLKRPKSQKNIGSQHYACMIQDSFRLLFQSTCMDHLLPLCPNGVVREDLPAVQEITARCVYKAVDNVHSHRFEQTNQSFKDDGKIIEGAVEESNIGENGPSVSDSNNNKCTGNKVILDNIPGLVPKLRGYQGAAVQWMLERENGDYDDRGWEICWIVIGCYRGNRRRDFSNSNLKHAVGTVIPLYQWKSSPDVDYLFYNMFTGWLVGTYQDAKVSTVGSGGPVRGGILAESMGLGKTVEVLACILSNPCSPGSMEQPIIDFNKKPGKSDSTFDVDEISAKGEYLCFCGRNGYNKNSLSWVVCSNCHDPMHGLCAGFSDENELMDHTWALSNRKSQSNSVRICDETRCPICVAANCARTGNLIHSRATLIVTPPSILCQWEREIRRHTIQSLKVKIYHGVKETCNLTHVQAKEGLQRRLINAQYLADADIVLTTFTALMNDLSHSDNNPYVVLNNHSQQRVSRKRKRYRIVPSPLMSINWWRIALDEAQRVETPTASSALMALKLVSRHRWCISGTPIGRGKVDDLFGLLLFLQSKPFCEKDWFKSCLKSAEHEDMLGRISHMLQDSLWRSTKANSTVRDQMGIPEQIEKRVILKFSSIERHFYQKQLEDTILAAGRIFDKSHSSFLQSRKAKDAEMLSDQLRKLRAACCHPQVGSSGIGKIRKQHGDSKGINIASGVLSMSQILDKLIDDAKLQAEEAQRIYTLNTNALACLYKLKAESCRINGSVHDEEENKQLLKSSEAYLNAIEVADKNSQPCAVVGEAILSGNEGFQKQGVVVRNGAVCLSWVLRLSDDEIPCSWARFDFSGSTKKINSFAIKPAVDVNIPEGCVPLFPHECCLQVSNAAIGGMFVDSLTFTLNQPNPQQPGNSLGWHQFHSLKPHKSKNWRIYVKSYHPLENEHGNSEKFFVALEVQLMEPEIIPDSLQRLHILHNGVITLTSWCHTSGESNANITGSSSDKRYSVDDILETIERMKIEKDDLESHYVEAARALQLASDKKLWDMSRKRLNILRELQTNSRGLSSKALQPWWQDLLSWCHMNSIPQNQVSLAEFVEDALFELFNDPSQTVNRRSFPIIHTVEGLNMALAMKLQEHSFFQNILENEIYRCIESTARLSDHPTDNEILENSHCHKCRSDWDQKGPKCKCCELEEELVKHERYLKDQEINCVFQSMSEWIKSTLEKERRSSRSVSSSSLRYLTNLSKQATIFFELQDAVLKELELAKSKWKAHFNLLSDIDELNQCKRTMRLAYQGENLWEMTAHERAFIVNPSDIPVIIMDHTAKQVMAEGNLRRLKDLLRFLKNQNQEQILSSQELAEDHVCSICLCPFNHEKAVLCCGHAFHYNPCIQRLLSRSGGTITCPMRCPIRTKKDGILIASDFRKDDGSKVIRNIEGQWGTKVNRLVSDLLSVVEIGEKSIVFSQWDDMLSIMENALIANSIHYVRPLSIKKFGAAMTYFRTSKCHVLLLNIKHGAEGLTLVEANHIFMIEPLLNHSMDAQVINRIHRIGQTSKTYIHRYIIEDTVEVKIDKLRTERQSHDGEEEDSAIKTKQSLAAGGVDGGFDEHELKTLLI